MGRWLAKFYSNSSLGGTDKPDKADILPTMSVMSVPTPVFVEKKYEAPLLREIESWPQFGHEFFEERAAIMEYDGQLDQESAEVGSEFFLKKILRERLNKF